MTLNGAPWLPRGVTLQALVQSVAQLQSGGDAARIAAQANYGTAELAAIRTFGADTIRFQISQPALDTTNSSGLYDPSYLSEVVSAVKLARQNGFVVMIMMQDEEITGETHHAQLPTQVTQTDWDVLNEQFATDPGVVYELYNEPEPLPTAANWALWLNGGTQTVNGQNESAMGMQTLITRLRGQGSQNVLILDGLHLAKTLQGVPTVSDPLNLLVYAVHPYPDGSADESSWDADFGIPSQTIPVWADEWSAGTVQKIGLGSLPNYQVAVDFLNYIRARKIGLGAGAFDVPGFMVQNVPGWTYTTTTIFRQPPTATMQVSWFTCSTSRIIHSPLPLPMVSVSESHMRSSMIKQLAGSRRLSRNICDIPCPGRYRYRPDPSLQKNRLESVLPRRSANWRLLQ